MNANMIKAHIFQFDLLGNIYYFWKVFLIFLYQIVCLMTTGAVSHISQGGKLGGSKDKSKGMGATFPSDWLCQ